MFPVIVVHTQVSNSNLARDVMIFGLQDHIKCVIELVRFVVSAVHALHQWFSNGGTRALPHLHFQLNNSETYHAQLI